MNERELQIYAKVGDFNGFKQAKEMIEQDQIDRYIPELGRERVRKEITSEGTEFTAIVKAFKDGGAKGVANRDEETVTITEAFFDVFARLGGKRIKKNRFIFFSGDITITRNGDDEKHVFPPVKIEVDVPVRPDGRTPDYVKIDVEVQDLLAQIEAKLGTAVSKVDIDFQIDGLPFVPQEAFIADDLMSDEQKSIVDNFWVDNAWPMPGDPPKQAKASVDEAANGGDNQNPDNVQNRRNDGTEDDNSNGRGTQDGENI